MGLITDNLARNVKENVGSYCKFVVCYKTDLKTKVVTYDFVNLNIYMVKNP